MKKMTRSILRKLGVEVRRYPSCEGFLAPFTLTNAKKFLYLKEMLEKISNRNGIVVECGVGSLVSFQMFCLLLENEGRGRELWGFDSFEGFPAPSDEDKSSRNLKKGQSKMPIEVAQKIIANLNVKVPTKLIKGYFEDTLPKAQVPEIALLHLDVDLYQSYKTCLEHLFSKVIKGGIILFDEYKGSDDILKFPGAQRAIDEYFAGKRETIQQDPSCHKYYVVKAG